MRKKIFAIVLSVIFILTFSSAGVLAEGMSATETNTAASRDDEYEGYAPIPLLIVVISFDANGNGVDDVARGYSSTDSTSNVFGEQWAYSPESYWGEMCFSDEGKSMKKYFNWMSDGNFAFTPAEESYGIANNGVVYATVNMQHPNASSGSSSVKYGNERRLALFEASNYIDFSRFDKNGDKNISFDELSLVFIIAGYNSKWGTAGKNTSRAWGMNCFEVSGSSWSVTTDGVTLLNGPKGGTFCYIGEYMNQSSPVCFGTIAHELGHVLGANDLYTYSGYTWCGSPGELALQGSGSSNCRPGELQGASPSAIDPYYLLDFGFQKATVASDGVFTLYSRESTKGKYNIIKVSTASPDEYYLIENRYTEKSESFDGITDGSKGIIIWHIDAKIMRTQILPDCWKGTPHAPGDTPLSPEKTVGNNGNAWDISDPAFVARNFKFDGTNTWTTQMTEEQAKGFNLKIQFLSECGNEMQVRISGTNIPSVSVESKTDTSITLKSLAGYEYRCGDGEWQTSNVFNGLSPNGTYTFYQRLAPTKTTYSSCVTSIAATTNKAVPDAPSAPTLELYDESSVTLVKTEGFEYKCGNGLWQTSNVFTGLSNGVEYTFYRRLAETEASYVSAASEGLSVTTEKAKPGTPSAPEINKVFDTSISFVYSEGYEYRCGDGEWQSGNVFTGLSAETEYKFSRRIAETSAHFSSDASTEISVKTLGTSVGTRLSAVTEYTFDNENGYLYGVEPNSKADGLLDKFTDKTNIRIIDKEGNDITDSDDFVIGTGCTVGITDGDGNLITSVEIVIRGDVNGDGKITVVDCMKLRAQQLGKLSELDGAYLKAALEVVPGAKKLSVVQYMKLRAYQLGKISSIDF